MDGLRIYYVVRSCGLRKKKHACSLHTQNLANNVKYLFKQICVWVQHNMKKTDQKRVKTRKGERLNKANGHKL